MLDLNTAYRLVHQVMLDANGVAGKDVQGCNLCQEVVGKKSAELAPGLKLKVRSTGKSVVDLTMSDVVWPQEPKSFAIGFGNWLRNTHERNKHPNYSEEW